jgi:hypothetical protein
MTELSKLITDAAAAARTVKDAADQFVSFLKSVEAEAQRLEDDLAQKRRAADAEIDRLRLDVEKGRRHLDELERRKTFDATLVGRRPAMRYQIKGQWPVDRTLLAAGTIVDTGQDEWKWLANTPPPPDAMALDQSAYNFMAEKYPNAGISSGPGVDRTRLVPLGAFAEAPPRLVYQLDSQGWVVGGAPYTHIPGGTRFDTGATEWRSLADRVPPMNAQALNQAAYDSMAAKYPTNWILSGPDVIRHADLG